jgi:hypothetical protein
MILRSFLRGESIPLLFWLCHAPKFTCGYLLPGMHGHTKIIWNLMHILCAYIKFNDLNDEDLSEHFLFCCNHFVVYTHAGAEKGP